jgi:glycopeptide antibiotics resistance protein
MEDTPVDNSANASTDAAASATIDTTPARINWRENIEDEAIPASRVDSRQLLLVRGVRPHGPRLRLLLTVARKVAIDRRRRGRGAGMYASCPHELRRNYRLARRRCVKSLTRILLAIYSIILIWLILFKFSVHIAAVLHYDKRSLNLVPFSNSSGSASEIVDNVLVFIPFGVMLGINFKRFNLWSKLLVVLLASIGAETIQYIFAIGATDITDVITNTLGGLLGLIGYGLSSNHFDQARLDRFIVIAGSIFLGCCVLLLVAVEVRHGVRYHRHGQTG